MSMAGDTTLRGVSGIESTAYVRASASAAVLNPVQMLDVWVVGDGGLVLHFDGTTWTEQSVGAGALRSVFALSTSDVWACGDNGMLLHYDGSNWSAVASGTSRLISLPGPQPSGHVTVSCWPSYSRRNSCPS